MRFSTKSTYGIKALIKISKHSGDSFVSLASIAKSEKISPKYLEKIFSRLKKTSFLKAEKGTAGGYRLNKPPDKITVYDIIEALEGKFAPFHCVNNDRKIFCRSDCHCSINYELIKIQDSISESLKKIKLSDLIN